MNAHRRRLLPVPALALLAPCLVFAEPVPPASSPAAAEKKPAVANTECLDCHEAELKALKPGEPKVWVGVRSETYAHSAHAKLNCVDCHTTITETPHDSKLPAVQCVTCHEKSLAAHAFHPRLALSPMPAGRDTACGECHPAHETVAKKSPDFAFAGPAQVDACGRCHQPAALNYRGSAHAVRPDDISRSAPDCLDCHATRLASPAPGQSRVELKLAQAKLCESCHVGNPEVASQSNLGAKFVASFDHSVHGAALAAGHDQAAGCVDCHGAHAMNKASAASARVNLLRVAETCAKCHPKQAADFATSVHASALRKGNLDSAGCTSCHGEHDIKLHTDPASPVSKANLAQQVCAECHASLRLTRRYGLASDTFKTYSDSYHGLAGRGGAAVVVNCASCHGAHAIRAQDDPASSINPAHLAQTCGQCHQGANAKFAVGAVHASETHRESSPWLYWIANFYVALIVAVVGGMLIHNLLDFLRKARHKLAVQKGEVAELHVAHRLYLRMTVNERLQHAVLVLSFTALVISGFMLRYPEAWWVAGIRHLSSSAFELRGLVHRIASVVMLASGVWHLGYLAFTAPGRKLFREMLPAWRDVTDPWQVLKYNLGLAPAKPPFGRFCYIEKAEYWAMAWGTALMTVTGAILWFDNASMGYITKLGFDIARLVHFYEAVLATLAIIVWHFYFVIFNPDVYPMNLAWLTGRMSEQEMLDEHPLQLEELKKAEGGDEKPPADVPPANPS